MTTSSSSPMVSQYSSLASRYNDAYTMARFQTKLGEIIKSISILIGILVALVSGLFMLFGMNESSFGPNLGKAIGGFGIVIGVAGGFVGWILGVMISSLGQLLKAHLDTAVNTSPFLGNDDRARIMSL